MGCDEDRGGGCQITNSILHCFGVLTELLADLSCMIPIL